MSLEPLRITGGRTFADGLATIAAFMGIAPGFALPPYTILLFDTSAPIGTRLLYLTLNLACILSFVLIGPLLIGLALGRPHTGGSRSRFFRYQLGAVGFGAGLGFGFTPAMLEAPTAWWITGITTGILVGGLSLLPFRTSGHQTLRRPPPAAPRHRLDRRDRRQSLGGGHGLHSAPQLAVIRFADARGRVRFVRHLVQRHPTAPGTMGQVQLDRRRPERVLRFSVGLPLRNHPGRASMRNQDIPPRNRGISMRNTGRLLTTSIISSAISLSFLRENVAFLVEKDFSERFLVTEVTLAFSERSPDSQNRVSH